MKRTTREQLVRNGCMWLGNTNHINRVVRGRLVHLLPNSANYADESIIQRNINQHLVQRITRSSFISSAEQVNSVDSGGEICSSRIRQPRRKQLNRDSVTMTNPPGLPSIHFVAAALGTFVRPSNICCISQMKRARDRHDSLHNKLTT